MQQEQHANQKAALGMKLLNAIRPQALPSSGNDKSDPSSDSGTITKLQESIDILKSLTINTPGNSTHSTSLNSLGNTSIIDGILPLNLQHPTSSRWMNDLNQPGGLCSNNFSTTPLSSHIGLDSGLFHQRYPPGLVPNVSELRIDSTPPGINVKRETTRPPPGLKPLSFPGDRSYMFSIPSSQNLFPVSSLDPSTIQPSLAHTLPRPQPTNAPWNNQIIPDTNVFNNVLPTSATLSTLTRKNFPNSTDTQPEVKIPTTSDRAKSTALLSMLKSKAGEAICKSTADEIFEGSKPIAEERVQKDDHSIEQQVRKVNHFRNTKSQVGQLIIKIRNSKINTDIEIQDGFYTRPGSGMTVVWKIPVEHQCEVSADIVVGLLRYGSQVNMPSIIAKSIVLKNSNIVDNYRVGSIQFFAPKAAGQFVFRLFNQASRESSMETIGTSVSFSVVLVDSDVINNLQHVLEAFEDQLAIKAISQLTLVVKGIKSCTNNTKECSHVLNRCIDQVIDQINATLPVLDEGVKKKQMTKALQANYIEMNEKPIIPVEEQVKNDRGDSKDSEEEEFWKSFRQALRIHAEAHDAFQALVDRKTPWYLVSEKLKNTIKFMEGLFCPVLKRYFRNIQEMTTHRTSMLDFSPASTNISSSTNILRALNNEFHQLIPKLLPGNEFQNIREKTRARLEFDLISLNSIPPGTSIAMYGSSANNFGSDGADLDMCLIFPSGVVIKPEERSVVIDRIGEVLTKLGMKDVRTRSTARIPIVQFHDEVSGLDCDISLHNPLALANTKLLRTYSNIDQRVRQMAYIIKHWAKRRHINSPQDGTLSSYGYILTILHFLQV